MVHPAPIALRAINANVELMNMTLGPLPPVPNWIRVVLSGVVDGTAEPFPWANVLHFDYSGAAPTASDMHTLAVLIGAAWDTNVAPLCPSPTHMTKVLCTDLTSDSASEGEDITVHHGTRGDDSIPANAAVLISYPVTTRYRGGHPRQYLYCLGNADLTGAAAWTSGATGEVLAGWQAFLLAIEAITVGATSIGSFGFIRYYGKFKPNDGPPRFRLVTPIPSTLDVIELIAHQEIASQRRRVGRRKR